MATKKAFVAKHGLNVGSNVVFGSNNKLHANNTITTGTITDDMLVNSPTDNTNKITQLENNLIATNTAIRSTITDNDAEISALQTEDGDLWTGLTGTNTAIRSLVSDESARVDLLNSNLLSTNTAIRGVISSEVSDLVASAPATLDTLNELAAALGDDANFATTVSTNLGQKLGSTATVALTGAVTGSATFSANAMSIATTATADPTITLAGDLSGAVTLTNLGDGTLTATIADDSHNHTIANVDGLQTALNTKATWTGLTGTNTAIRSLISSNDSDISALQGRATALETEDGDLWTGLTGTNTAIRSLISSNDSDISALQGRATALEGTDIDVTLTGAVTGSGTISNLGDVSITTTATADPTITLAGDLSGSATLTNLGNATLTATIADDSHNHVVSNVDGLQAALDAKLASSSYTAADVLTKIKTVDGSGSGLDADLLDGQSSAYYTGYADSAVAALADSAPATLNTLNELAAALGDDANYATTISTNLGQKLGSTASVALTGDVSGSGSFSANAVSIAVTVADDSHNHTIANVDGLQTALDNKIDDSQVLTNVPSGAVFTDNNTTYSVGDGGLSEINFTSADHTKLNGIETSATADQTQADINALGITATSVDLGNWTITESAGVVYFATLGVNKMKLDASGNLTCVGDVVAYGTV